METKRLLSKHINYLRTDFIIIVPFGAPCCCWVRKADQLILNIFSRQNITDVEKAGRLFQVKPQNEDDA